MFTTPPLTFWCAWHSALYTHTPPSQGLSAHLEIMGHDVLTHNLRASRWSGNSGFYALNRMRRQTSNCQLKLTVWGKVTQEFQQEVNRESKGLLLKADDGVLKHYYRTIDIILVHKMYHSTVSCDIGVGTFKRTISNRFKHNLKYFV